MQQLQMSTLQYRAKRQLVPPIPSASTEQLSDARLFQELKAVKDAVKKLGKKRKVRWVSLPCGEHLPCYNQMHQIDFVSRAERWVLQGQRRKHLQRQGSRTGLHILRPCEAP